MSAPVLALIGGTGLYHLAGLEAVERHLVDTPYGFASDAVRKGDVVCFVA